MSLSESTTGMLTVTTTDENGTGTDDTTGGGEFTCGRQSVSAPQFLPIDVSDGQGRLVAVVAIDSDVTPDAVLLEPGLTSSVALNSGDGLFQQPLPIEGGPFVVLTPLRANADDSIDLAAVALTQRGSATMSLLLGNGDGAFVETQTIELDGPVPVGIAGLDVEADGDDDLFLAGEVKSALFINDGQLQPPIEILAGGPGPYTTGDTVVGDFDAAAGNDVVVHASWIFVSDGLGGLTYAASLEGTAGGFAAMGMLDSDQSPDLAIGETSDVGGPGLRLSVALDSLPLFGATEDIVGCVSCPAFDKPEIADVNGDGAADIVYPSTAGISIFLGCGDGTFAGPWQVELDESVRRVIASDLNGDGVLDLATTAAESAHLYVLLGNG